MANKPDEDRKDRNTPDMEGRDAFSSRSGSEIYEIRVKGHLNSHWSDWLEGMEVKLLDNGEMILLGPIVDQAALMGVLNKLGRLNLALLSVNKVQRKERNEEI